LEGKTKLYFPSRRRFLRKLTHFSSLKSNKFWNIYMASSHQTFRVWTFFVPIPLGLMT